MMHGHKCRKFDQLCSAVVDFSLLIVVLNIDIHSFHTELCSLYSTTYYYCLFVAFFLTGMEPDDSIC